MLSNIAMIAAAIIVMWIVVFAIYMVVSRRQTGLQDKLRHVEDQMSTEGKEDIA